ncbi:MAG: beta-propeller domain-containing protein, partial [Methanocellales archaeon]
MKGKIALLLLLLSIASSCIAISIAFSPSKPALKKFSSCEEIKNFLKANEEIPYFSYIARDIAAPAFKGTPESIAPSMDYSTTNIQAAGVDEADFVKNDGKYIYAISGSKVFIVDAYPAEQAKVLAEIEFECTPLEIFLNKDRLVVFEAEQSYYPLREGIAIAPRYYSTLKTFIKIYDISDKENPKLIRNLSIEGSYYDSRMIGDYVYAVINKNVYDSRGEISIPKVISEEANAICRCSDVYYFDVPDSSYFFSTIVAINTQNEEKPESKIFLMGYSQEMYVSRDNIYIAYQKRLSSTYYYKKLIEEVLIPAAPSELVSKINEISSSNITMYTKIQEMEKIFHSYMQRLSQAERTNLEQKLEEKIGKLQEEIEMEMQKTAIHKISIDGSKIEHQAQGEVPGVVLNQFSMD